MILSYLDELIRKQPRDGTIGGIRAKKVRRLYGLERIGPDKKKVNVLTKPFNLKELKEVSDICKTWCDETELMPFKKVYIDEEIRFVPDLNTSADIYCRYLDEHGIRFTRSTHRPETILLDVERWEYDYKVCCKRGNSVYLKMVKDKFKPLERWSKTDDAKQRIGFSTVLNNNRKRIRKGNLFFITLTLDHDIIKNVGESWLKSGNY